MEELTKMCISSIERFFEKTNGKTAIVGISGGKDSAVVAALCVKALGKENVIGVLMPNGEQSDIEDAYKICKFLDIKHFELNIKPIFDNYFNSLMTSNIEPSQQAKINVLPRIRMTMLYFVAQSFKGGRVMNTSNASEKLVGYGTLWGDIVGDFSPLGNLYVSEVCAIGDDLCLPAELVHKIPSDGLTGKSDEESLGVTYDDIEMWGRHEKLPYETWHKIFQLHDKNKFKGEMINLPTF